MNFELKTERLTLKSPTENDVDVLFELMSDNSITTFLSWEAHKNIETTKSVIQSLIRSQKENRGYHWCIWCNNNIIGLVSLIDVKRTIRTWTLNRCELSYWISPGYQGRGFATEASRAVVDFGFYNLYFHKLIIAHAADNVESESICKKLGFVEYAHEHDAFKKNEKWHDLKWYERINDNK